jgi:urea transport system permease protein
MIAHAEITVPATPGATRSSNRPEKQTALRSSAFPPLRYVFGVFLALFLICANLTSAHAQSLDEALVKLGKNSFSDTIAAIEEIAVSDAEHAQAILNALADRRLLIGPDDTVYYKDASGKLYDGRSGVEIAPPEGRLTAARVNNRLRNVIRAALGTMTLASSDPDKRRSAAATIFRSREAEALAAVRRAKDKEQIPEIATALAEAEASILLGMANASQAEKIAAIKVLEARGDQDVMGLLRPAMNDANAEVAVAASGAVASIQSRLVWVTRVQNIWYGLSLGSVLLLAAIGLAITFGVMGVINMAHGEMVMLGAYTTFVVQEVFRAYAPGLFDYSLLVAVPAAFAVAGLVGIAIERGIIRFLYGRPLETLLATWGVSLILQQAVRTIFGASNREVGAPSYMQGGFDFFGLAVTYNRLWIIVFTLVVFAALLLILKRTPLGLQMRAVTQNRRMAASMGIRTGYVDAMTFALGSGIAGIAGVALSQIDNVSPNLGQSYIIDSFLVVVFGGVGNLWGTFVSAFSLGIANKFLEPWAGAVLAKIFMLVLLILFIQKRPRGLFALKGRAVEA